MVVFTCQHCGSSLTKNKVEKHYIVECRRNNPHVTCVDCLKDFRGNEFVAHTQCMTEEQRYAAKGFVAKTPPSVKKRATWLNSVESSLNTPGLTQAQKNLIQNLLKHSNIPQKRKKFQNFIKSAFGRQFSDLKLVDSVFDILDETHKTNVANETSESTVDNNSKHQLDGDEENNAVHKNKEDLDDAEEEIGASNELNEETEKIKKKKTKKSESKNHQNVANENSTAVESHDVANGINNSGKKRKSKLSISEGESHQNADNENSTAVESHDIVANGVNNSGKKKKKKLSTSETENHQNTDVENSMAVESQDITANGVNNSNGVIRSDQKLSKKELKAFKKRAKYEAQLNEIENNKNVEEAVIDDENSKEMKKKKKKNKIKGTEENVLDNEVNGVKKDKKNKRPMEDNNNDEPLTKKTKKIDSEILNKSIEPNEEGYVFNWTEIIVKVLESRSDKELPVKRLCKKIINEYQAVFGENHMTYEKLLSKFNKKLHKLPNVKVLKDKAKLTT